MHTRISAAGRSVTVVCEDEAVCQSVADAVRPCWHATTGRGDIDSPVIDVTVDPTAATALADTVTRGPHQRGEYDGATVFYRTEDADGRITACQPDRGVAFHYHPGIHYLTAVGPDLPTITGVAVRAAMDIIGAQLLDAGWRLLRAAAVARNKDGSDTLLVLGADDGTTITAALSLAQHHWSLIGAHRLLARAFAGRVRILPWPTPVPIGSRSAAALLLDRGVDPDIIDGLDAAAGRAWSLAGKPLARRRPAQLASLGPRLAQPGARHVSRALLVHADRPAIARFHHPGHTPKAVEAAFPADHPFSFPPARLQPDAADRRETLAALIAALPASAVTLGGDVRANTTLLADYH